MSKASIAFSNPQYNLRIAKEKCEKSQVYSRNAAHLFPVRLKAMLCGAMCLSQWSTIRYDARSFDQIIKSDYGKAHGGLRDRKRHPATLPGILVQRRRNSMKQGHDTKQWGTIESQE
jgi:hypothetical protein